MIDAIGFLLLLLVLFSEEKLTKTEEENRKGPLSLCHWSFCVAFLDFREAQSNRRLTCFLDSLSSTPTNTFIGILNEEYNFLYILFLK